MVKNFSKLLLSLFLVVTLTSTFLTTLVEATEAVTTSETVSDTTIETTTSQSTDTVNTTEPEIHNGDLYLLGTDLVMDKLVDGNVFIIGDNVEITGKINGSLFILANNIIYNGACNDLYVVCSKKLEMTYDSYVIRDIKALTNNILFKTAVGRNVDIYFNSADLGEGNDVPIVYGNLNYASPKEITIPENVMASGGSVTYTAPQAQNSSISMTSLYDILMNILVSIVTVLVVYFVIKRLTPKFTEKLSCEKISVIKILKYFGMGIASIVIATIIFILLAISQIGIKLAFIFALLFIALCLISIPIFAIVITNILKPLLKINKTILFCLILCAVKIILYLVTLIPYVGWIFSVTITPISIGMLINLFIPHKELTDEEKAAIEEAKEQKKELKEKIKQEKLEAKLAKKQAKLEAKESENNDNI